MSGLAVFVFVFIGCGLLAAAEFPLPVGMTLEEFRNKVRVSESRT